MAQTTQSKKINLSDFSADEKNVVGFNSYYSSSNENGKTTEYIQQNKIALDKQNVTDKKVLLSIKDNATNKLQIFCYQVDGKNYAMVPKNAISDEAKIQLDNILKDDANSESKEYIFEIEKIDLIDSSVATKPKGFQLQLKGNDENKITINSNARALQISIDGKPIEQKQPEGNTKTSVFGYSFTTSLIKDCFSKKTDYANIYTTNGTSGELQPATNISGFSTEFLLALANCHEKTTKPYSIIDYGDLKLFHAPLVKGIGGKNNNTETRNELVFARIKTKSGKEKYKDYVLSNGSFKPVSQVAYTYTENNTNDIGIDFAIGASQATVELPIKLDSNKQSKFVNNDNYKIINAFSRFLADSSSITQLPDTNNALPDIKGGHIRIGDFIEVVQADKTGFREISTEFVRENVSILNQNIQEPIDFVDPGPDSNIPEDPSPVNPEDPVNTDPDVPKNPEEPGPIDFVDPGPDSNITVDPSPVNPQDPVNTDPDVPKNPEEPKNSIDNSSNTSQEPSNKLNNPSSQPASANQTASNKIPNVDVKKERSSFGPFIKTLGILALIASVFLFVGAVLVPGVAALVPAAIGCLCAGGALYFGSNFIDGKMNIDSIFNSAINNQKNRKKKRERKAKRFLSRENKIENLRSFGKEMSVKTKAKRLAKAQKLEDRNFNSLASGDFRFIEQLSILNENKAIELEKSKHSDKELTDEEIFAIKQEARNKFISDNALPIAQSVLSRHGEKATRAFLSNCSQQQRTYITSASNDIINAIQNDKTNKNILGTALSNYLVGIDTKKASQRIKYLANVSTEQHNWLKKYCEKRNELELAYEAAEAKGKNTEELRRLIRLEQKLENDSAINSRKALRNTFDKVRAKLEEKHAGKNELSESNVQPSEAITQSATSSNETERNAENHEQENPANVENLNFAPTDSTTNDESVEAQPVGEPNTTASSDSATPVANESQSPAISPSDETAITR